MAYDATPFFFSEHDIDVETLKLLNENAIKELIPKVGHRVRFCTKLQEYMSVQEAELIVLVSVISFFLPFCCYPNLIVTKFFIIHYIILE